MLSDVCVLYFDTTSLTLISSCNILHEGAAQKRGNGLKKKNYYMNVEGKVKEGLALGPRGGAESIKKGRAAHLGLSSYRDPPERAAEGLCLFGRFHF